ncbi:lariat debranching enzyme [Knufia fluminis]|uniref:Lariat debranching enzyme n=1 Tax=Knufia fluminis TaxID=191047 RepID=A0AAN8ELE5_9EURO|nr:lariat debranching enzyme [Knufia fluminis]
MSSQGLRIAVEGCGHGTLDAIYASVQKSCKIKGWDGVDLLIICGDFQAVRNQKDLNVTAMPAKYRKMGDFHQYYYGTKTAPYLTVFIGGNHEASNHLFELYYGGWAAPNIYYLGAANVVKLGPLKIAAMSGIYKEHDYRKPHFERLPYSEGNMRSIYHQREIDVRKLLAYRSQVDIGLSHDWPHQIEWLGDHKFLFWKKNYFLEDALKGELGSKAAASVMDRLRPSHWFSGHMHFKYAAVKNHEKFDQSWIQQAQEQYRQPPRKQVQILKRSEEARQQDRARANSESSSIEPANPAVAAAVSGWTSFGDTVEGQDAEAFEREMQAQKQHEEQFGKRTVANYNFEETFKEVNVAQDGNAQNRQALTSEQKPVQQIPQLDGACSSSQKRRRKSSPSDNTQATSMSRNMDQTDGVAQQTSNVTNPDAIDIDMSDSEDDGSTKAILPKAAQQSRNITNPDAIDVDMSDSEEDSGTKMRLSPTKGTSDSKTHEYRHPTGRKLYHPYQEFPSPARSSPKLASIREMRSKESVQPSLAAAGTVGFNPQGATTIITNSITLLPQYADSSSFQGGAATHNDPEQVHDTSTPAQLQSPRASTDSFVIVEPSDTNSVKRAPSEKAQREIEVPEARPEESQSVEKAKGEDEVPEDVRAQLAAMSATFAREEKVDRTPDLPFPSETIPNKMTRFLALSKVEKGKDFEFLQLLEIDSMTTNATTEELARPLKLEYDPEWLAILRVFAPELVVGGASNQKISPHRGDTYYRDRILEEEEWVQKNIVDKNLLVVPENFEVTTTIDQQDDGQPQSDSDMPREQTNPQTAQFCELIGIENKFDFSEKDRDARMTAGTHGGGGDSYRGGHQNFSGGGRGRGGRGGGRGRGRGRGRGGRGRGQW